MKSENLITPAELNALLTPAEREQLEAKFDCINEKLMGNQDQVFLAELQEAVLALTLRVELLEQLLRKQSTELERAAVMAPYAMAEPPSIPEPESFSRSESYGRNRKKKKSLFQKLLD